MSKILVLIISGPSGSGKSSLCKKLLENHIFNLHLSVSATTRLKREHEINKKEYIFLTQNQFNDMLNQDQLIEYVALYDNLYGTPKANLEQAIMLGQNLLFDIDARGSRSIKQYCSNMHNIICLDIYIMPPSINELEQRLIKRGDLRDSIKTRISSASIEMQYANEYSYIITNQNLDDSYKEICDILLSSTK